MSQTSNKNGQFDPKELLKSMIYDGVNTQRTHLNRDEFLETSDCFQKINRKMKAFGFNASIKTIAPSEQVITFYYPHLPEDWESLMEKPTISEAVAKSLKTGEPLNVKEYQIPTARSIASARYKGECSIILGQDGHYYAKPKDGISTNSISAQIRRASDGELIKINGNVQSYRQVASQSPANVTVFKHGENYYCTNDLIKPFWVLKLHTEGMDENTVKDFMNRVGLV